MKNVLSGSMQVALERLSLCGEDALIFDVMVASAKVLMAYAEIMVEMDSHDNALRALNTADAILKKIESVRGRK